MAKAAPATRSSWRGAAEFAGFPVNIALYPRVATRSGESFRMLAPSNHQPVTQAWLDTDGEIVERADTLRGIEVGKNEFVVLPDEALEQIQSAERTTVLEADAFAPVSTVPLEFASAIYEVLPDDKVAGADRSANVLWNGLWAAGLAYMTKITMRAGSSDQVLAIYATDQGLFAATLPFINDIREPRGEWTVDEKQGALFAQVVEANYEVAELDLAAFASEYRERRAQAVETVLAGGTVEVKAAPAPAAAVPDLMAALEAMSETPPPAKAKARKTAAARKDKVKA